VEECGALPSGNPGRAEALVKDGRFLSVTPAVLKHAWIDAIGQVLVQGRLQ